MSLKQVIQYLAPAFCLIFYYTGAAQAATVKAKSSKSQAILIELSPEESIVKGDEICFFTKSAKQVGCGKVTSIKGKRARVRVKRKVFSRVRKGMGAQTFGYADGDILGSGSSGGGSKSSANKPMRIYGFGLLAMTPFTHQNLLYDRGIETLWDPGKTASALAMGAGFEVAIPVGSFAIIPGFRYQLERSQTIESDYGTTSNPYSVNTVKSSAMGVWADFEFWTTNWGGLMFGAASGLDIDMSKVTFAMNTKDENTGITTDIASASSSLNVISLRLSTRMDYMFTKSFGVNFTPTILIPITEMGKKFSGEVNDPNAPATVDVATDLETSLGHKKASFGFNGMLSVVMTF